MHLSNIRAIIICVKSKHYQSLFDRSNRKTITDRVARVITAKVHKRKLLLQIRGVAILRCEEDKQNPNWKATTLPSSSVVLLSPKGVCVSNSTALKATCLAPSQQPNSGSNDMIWQSNSSSPPGQSRTESHTLRGSMHSAPERQENWGAIQ